MKSALFIVNYFYPEVASTGQLMTELCLSLQNQFDITVIAAFPSYTGSENLDQYKGKKVVYENFEKIKIIRVAVPAFDKTLRNSRFKYIGLYFINALKAVLKAPKHDIVFVISQPPILGGLLGVLTKIIKGSKFIYAINDFNPEQMEAVDYVKNKHILIGARWLDNISCKFANQNVVVGRDMEETLYRRCKGVSPTKVRVINNWIDETKIYPLKKEHFGVQEFLIKYNLQDKFIIMYSGNIGLYYDLENIIKVFAEFEGPPDLVFVLVGDGAKRRELEEYCRNHSVRDITFIPYQPKDNLVYSLNAADIHLVTNQKGIKGVSVPSKIYGVMAVGKPILGVLEKGSEAQLLITQSNCGRCVEPGDYQGMKDLLSELITKRRELETMGLRGRTYLEENYKCKDSLKKYNELLTEL
jgi:glycosyltransferase involved in cell wall biosynthesis